MKVIITGGSGFIGSHVVDEVLAAGHEVVIYDTEAPRFGQKCGYVRGDIRDIDRLSATAKGAEIIYNLAAEANVNRFFEMKSACVATTSALVKPSFGLTSVKVTIFPATFRNGMLNVLVIGCSSLYTYSGINRETCLSSPVASR